MPAQTLEIVRSSRDRLADAGMATTPMFEGDTQTPQNRLIWTNDNLVALTSLRDGDEEHDPLAGKVDLIYIDPPFAVQNNFTINVEVEDGVSDEKLPTLIEQLAYEDTWKEGLDSYLSMMRDRLEVLKQLLAPTGSIYVHRDWHAGHYLKVLMDEVFGYANFLNEIVWKRTTAHSDSSTWSHVTDTLLFYGTGPVLEWNPQRTQLKAEYVAAKYTYRDEHGRTFRLDNITSPHPRPNMMYEWRGFAPPANGWRYSADTMQKFKTMAESGTLRTKQGARSLRGFLMNHSENWLIISGMTSPL